MEDTGLADTFKQMVAQYIGYSWGSGNYDAVRANELVAVAKCSRPTVIRFISGVADPSDDVKKLVIDYIRAQKQVSKS